MSTSSLVSDPLSALPRLLARNWWLFLFRGIAALVFGVLSLIWPVSSILALTLLFGAYALVDGAFALGAAFAGPGDAGTRWWLALVGIAGIGAGIATFSWPGLTALTLLYFIAGWFVATGVLQIIGAIELRKMIKDEWWLILNGALGVLFGIFIIVMPGAGALAVVWIIACVAILYGLLMIGFAFKVRNFKEHAR
jgi:uncharacterized membrane protein HdeD (DUF308 family)